MGTDPENPITDHEYDGIREYDNPLPNWWLVTFYATIIFSFIYWIHYEFGGGQTQLEELSHGLAVIENAKLKGKSSQSAGVESEVSFDELMKSPEIMGKAKELYQLRCSPCHGSELQGGIGPNLVDDYWIHGKALVSDISQIIKVGVPAKGMPGWESLFKPEELRAVAAFIASKKGSQPNQPKAPQGTKIGGS